MLSNIFFFLLTEHKKKFKTAGYKVELHKQQQPVLSDLRQGDRARSQRWARTPCPSTRGQEQSSGPPVQRNPLRGTVQPPREGQARFRVSLPHAFPRAELRSQNPTWLVGAEGEESVRLADSEDPAVLVLLRKWGEFSLLAGEEAFTRLHFAASFPICIAFCFNKSRSAGEIPRCAMSVGIKPTLKKTDLTSLVTAALVATLDTVIRVLVDNPTGKGWRGSNVLLTPVNVIFRKNQSQTSLISFFIRIIG